MKISTILCIVLVWAVFFTGKISARRPAESAIFEPGAPARSFRIGYLHGDPEAQLHSGRFYALRDFLLERPSLRQAMQAEGIEEIVLLSSDSHEHLIERMNHNEFDMVFCSAKDFVSQRGSYEVLYQLRRRDDRFDPGGKRVFHYADIFVNSDSELFTGELTPLRMQEYFLQNDRIALVSSFSAAGYDYPLLKIAEFTSNTLPQEIIFCQSSEEVVKYVLNGVTEVGACDSGVIDKVLENSGLAEEKEKLIRVVLRTAPIPTDPVVLLTSWSPRESKFIQELTEGMRLFFRPEENKDIPRLERAGAAQYEDLRQNIERLRSMRK